jgi:Transcriptional regulators
LEDAMFTYDTIQKFNETEIKIYKFIVENGEKLPYMTIREFADEVQVSTSTILRFCNKLDCDGYREFKERHKKYVHQIQKVPPQGDLNEILHYLNKIKTNSFEQKIEEGAYFIRKAETVIFIGSGSSGALAKYAARYFSNLGKFSIGLEDTLYPITKDMHEANGGYNATTQVPVLFIIEALAGRI